MLNHKTFAASLLIALASILSTQQTIAAESDIHSRNHLLLIQIQNLKKDISRDQTRQTEVQKELQTTDSLILKIQKQLADLTRQYTQEENAINTLRKSQADYLQRLNRQHVALAQQVRMIYQSGPDQSIKTIFNLDNFNMIHRGIYYHTALSHARFDLLNDLKHTLNTLNNNMAAISQHEKNLNALLSQKKRQRLAAESAHKQRLALLAQLDKKTKLEMQQMSQLLANQIALQNTILALRQQPAFINNHGFTLLRGKLHWPLAGPIIGYYGSSIGIKDQKLNGVIIKPIKSASVRSISPGKVIFAGWLRGFGLLLIVHHGDGYMSLYGRNQALYAKVGDTVTPHDVIATVGNSKGYTSSSLYFEIRHNGTPIDPNAWCA